MADISQKNDFPAQLNALAGALKRDRGRLEVKVQQAIAYQSSLRGPLGPIPGRVNQIADKIDELARQVEADRVGGEEVEGRLKEISHQMKRLEQTAHDKGMVVSGRNIIADLLERGRRKIGKAQQVARNTRESESQGRKR